MPMNCGPMPGRPLRVDSNGRDAWIRHGVLPNSVVNDGGEIVALDGAGYGAITNTKNVTITANPGFYAGIAAAGVVNAVSIATAGISVTLRGLSINSTSAANSRMRRLAITPCARTALTPSARLPRRQERSTESRRAPPGRPAALSFT
jgi:hypothetical protein